VEYAGANLLPNSATLQGTGWNIGGNGVGGTVTVTNISATNPENGETCTRLVFGVAAAGGSPRLYYTTTAINPYTMFVWMRSNTPATNYTISLYRNDTWADFPVTPTWTRFQITRTSGTGLPGYFMLANNSTSVQPDILVWGAQLNPGSTAQTYYPTTTAAYHAPRFDYSPTNIGQPRGLLVEGQTANIATNSNALASAGGLTRTYPTGVISPDGTENAQRFTKSDATTPRYIYPTTLFTVPASTAYTASIWIKYDGYAFTTQIQSDTAMDWGGAWTAAFVIATGGITVGSRTGICSASTVTAYPNGWYRCTATITTGAAPTGANPRFLIDVVGTTGVSVLVYGLQLEAGSGASSYIPTGASQVTRTADHCTIPTASFIPGNPYPQTLFVDCIPNTPSGAFLDIVRVFDRTVGGTFSYGTEIYYYTASTMTVSRKIAASTNTERSFASGLAYGTRHKFALSIDASSYSGSYDGVTALGVATAPTALATVATHLGIGCSGDSSPNAVMFGTIRQIKFYPTALSQTQINTLTAL
jgi:hypothetical protein